jgi:hypothetical protein
MMADVQFALGDLDADTASNQPAGKWVAAEYN